MERLTEWIGEGEERQAVPKMSLRRNGHKKCCNKLAHYEDLEEQGLLLKLPCKVGTKVFYVQKCLAPSCKNCMGFTRVNNCYTEHKARIFEQEFTLRHLKAFGETVFLTKAEAEKALAEMEE